MKKIYSIMSGIAICLTSAAQDVDPGFTLWNGGYEKTNVEIVVGYVNKSWVNTYSAGTFREDFFGDSGKMLHGIQIGALYTPSFDWGLGLRTGVMLEAYVSRSPWVNYLKFTSFTEGDLYIPLQASFRIPFTDRSSVSIFAGPAFQLAMQGRFQKTVGFTYQGWWRRPVVWGTSKTMQYGYGWPEQVNWQTDCGLSFHFGPIGINLSYSFGFRNHEIQNTFDNGVTYETASRSRQDKMNAALVIAF